MKFETIKKPDENSNLGFLFGVKFMKRIIVGQSIIWKLQFLHNYTAEFVCDKTLA